ncbi:MAG: hypothetical protein ACXVIT_12405 [Halobacteriota archaeon]
MALHTLVDGIRTHAALVELHHTLEERFIHPMLREYGRAWSSCEYSALVF